MTVLLIALFAFIQPVRQLYWIGAVAGYVSISVVQYYLRSRYEKSVWISYVSAFIEFAFVVFILFQPPFLGERAIALQTLNKIDVQPLLILFLIFYGFSFRPILVLWAGVCASVFWFALMIYVIALPDTLGDPRSVITPPFAVIDPDVVGLGRTLVEITLFLVSACAIALIVARLRGLVAQRAVVERQRANLRRYIPTEIADSLAGDDRPFETPQIKTVVVVFVDIVGFTRRAMDLAPEETIDLLRAYDHLFTDCAFDYGGTVEKFLGDGVMVTFGRLELEQDDAASAVACAVAMIDRTWALTQERGEQPPVEIGIGIHMGDVVLGNVGAEERLEPAILGDVVNTASRMETLTRTLPYRLLISGAVYDAAVAVPEGQAMRSRMKDLGLQPIRGRDEPMRVYGLLERSSVDSQRERQAARRS
ncbi:adenylate/guanylate cyclase domain-containing protein [Bauldia sp.]|uniref:adenylate/guanylate cyclase domain-containing protein n=1 Tax=Bauldia sp. TaxID=2575872 RepID=UPI003BABA1F1